MKVKTDSSSLCPVSTVYDFLGLSSAFEMKLQVEKELLTRLLNEILILYPSVNPECQRWHFGQNVNVNVAQMSTKKHEFLSMSTVFDFFFFAKLTWHRKLTLAFSTLKVDIDILTLKVDIKNWFYKISTKMSWKLSRKNIIEKTIIFIHEED